MQISGHISIIALWGENQMKSADWAELLKYLSLVTWVGLIMAASVILGWLLGCWLERAYGGLGWTVAGLLLGVAGGGMAVYSTLQKMIPWE